MAAFYKYVKFFRFRAPINVFEFTGARKNNLSWLSDSILLLDYDKVSFIKEAFLVMYYTRGGTSLDRLEKMPFDEFALFVEEAFRIHNLSADQNLGED